MPDLQVQGAVSKGTASLDTLGTSDAQVFVYDEFEIRFLNKLSFDGGSRTQLVFCSRFQSVCSRFEITPAKIAVTAKVICMDAFNGGRTLHTLGGTSSALRAFE